MHPVTDIILRSSKLRYATGSLREITAADSIVFD